MMDSDPSWLTICLFYGEYYRQGQEREKEPQWRHQSLSEELRDFKLEALEPPAAADARSLLGAIEQRRWHSDKNTLWTRGLEQFAVLSTWLTTNR